MSQLSSLILAPSGQVQQQPPGAQGTTQSPWIQTATGAAQANNVTQPAIPGKTNYLAGILITGMGATAGVGVAGTITSGGTTIGNFTVGVPAGVTTPLTPHVFPFNPPISGLGPGQNLVVNVPSFGAGNLSASVTAWGLTQ